MALPNSSPQAANEGERTLEISPLSKELVIGLVGYAGSGCSTAARRLHLLLDSKGYDVKKIKLSDLICDQWPGEVIPKVVEGPSEGALRLSRAGKLQDLGDKLRSRYGNIAMASLAIRKIKALRGLPDPGSEKIAFIVESIKHNEEVELLRRVYDHSFRLVAVYCERPKREARLIGGKISSAKYKGVAKDEVLRFMERDEKDGLNDAGQQVRDAFYLADYFIDNNSLSNDGANLNGDIDRFLSLILGEGLVRPNINERAMYHAHAAALQSSCLSRQVGAVLVSGAGEVISTGTNDAPRFGGGVYSEDSHPDNRCHAWEWDSGKEKFKGCHNDRKKKDLRKSIAKWLSVSIGAKVAELAHPIPPQGVDTAKRARSEAEVRIKNYLESSEEIAGSVPGVKDLIEYSRAIHAEMDAILSAARSGISTAGATLYCTTYPCHGCARHLVAAGVSRVLYVEPYVKSLALELHSDAIMNELPSQSDKVPKMVIVPFTGVGPRMYEDFFAKRVKLKAPDGAYQAPSAGLPGYAVRLKEMVAVEDAAANLVPGVSND